MKKLAISNQGPPGYLPVFTSGRPKIFIPVKN
jgi:hypothetical protein